jgi:uncharacterized protein (DUF433 family)
MSGVRKSRGPWKAGPRYPLSGNDVVLAKSLPSAAVIPNSLTFGDFRPYVSLMDYEKYITIEPGKRGGKPCIRGLRITVYDVLDYLASGMTEAEILRDFPDLTSEDIRACLAFAADRERKLITIPA